MFWLLLIIILRYVLFRTLYETAIGFHIYIGWNSNIHPMQISICDVYDNIIFFAIVLSFNNLAQKRYWLNYKNGIRKIVKIVKVDSLQQTKYFVFDNRIGVSIVIRYFQIFFTTLTFTFGTYVHMNDNIVETFHYHDYVLPKWQFFVNWSHLSMTLLCHCKKFYDWNASQT